MLGPGLVLSPVTKEGLWGACRLCFRLVDYRDASTLGAKPPLDALLTEGGIFVPALLLLGAKAYG